MKNGDLKKLSLEFFNRWSIFRNLKVAPVPKYRARNKYMEEKLHTF
jgi:hypothetical protein